MGLGDICSVTVLGQPLIILNSAKMAIDMLDKKSAIYSDRPILQMAGELVGWKNTLVLLPYGDRFRRYRRLFHSLIGNQSMIKRFYPSEELEARKFLRRILAKPDDLAAHVRKYESIYSPKMRHQLITFCRPELQVPLFLESLMVTKSRKMLIPSSSLQTKQPISFLLPPLQVVFLLTSFQLVGQSRTLYDIFLTPSFSKASSHVVSRFGIQAQGP